MSGDEAADPPHEPHQRFIALLGRQDRAKFIVRGVAEAFGLCGLSMRDIQIARGRRGGHDGVHGGLRWSIGAWILDRLKGFRHVECSLVFFDRFHVDANMRRRGMKQAQKARGAHKVNIDAQQRFKRANRSGSLARTGLLSFHGGNPCVLQNVVKGTA
ncbi:MAG: hypothetical protein WBQ53_07085 [Methylocystis sp.]